MFLDQLGIFALGAASNLAAMPAAQFLDTLFTNARAVSYARDSLRPTYADLLKPASYDHVTESLRLTQEDFLTFYREPHDHTQLGLEAHLRARLSERASEWRINRPDKELFDRLLDDFYAAYNRYFLIHDPALATLQLMGVANEVLEAVTEISSRVEELSKSQVSRQTVPESLSQSLRTFLTVKNIPYELLEETDDHSDLLIFDPSSVFPSRIFVHTSASPLTPVSLGRLFDRTRTHPLLSSIVVVTIEPIQHDLVQLLRRHGAEFCTRDEFRGKFLRLETLEKYVVGNLATNALVESLNIQNFFIPLDGVAAYPGDSMENKYLKVRDPAVEEVERFLNNPAERILFLFGAYGTGKSALCAHTAKNLQDQDSNISTAYIALRNLKSADELQRILVKGEQIAKSAAPSKEKTLVILDGLDELPNAMQPIEKRKNMLRLLQACAQVNSKIIVTVRTSYFRGMEDFWKLFEREADNELWAQLAHFISEHGERPRIAAFILREFDNNQIDKYVSTFVETERKPNSFKREFYKCLDRIDPKQTYRMLARNPLYLFLLVHCEPWNNENVRCFSDVLSTFVDYWLERDINKGASRWLLTIQDRKDFIEEIAWEMFHEGRISIDFSEFDAFVTRCFGRTKTVADEEFASMTLDLQTTGFFSVVGKYLTFSLQAYSDYFVAERILRKRGADLRRLPTPDQSRLILGAIESRKLYLDGRDMYEINRRDIDGRLDGHFSTDPQGIIYFDMSNGWDWPIINTDDNTHSNRWIRSVVKGSMAKPEKPTGDVLYLQLGPGVGIHARPAARIVQACLDTIPKEGDVILTYDGYEANAKSILSILHLAASGNSVLGLKYRNCDRDEIDKFLTKLGAVPVYEEHVNWVWNDYD